MVEEARLESMYTPKGYPGFESLSLRNKGCKSSICEIYTLFYTQECKIGCFCIFKDSSKECQLQSDWYFYGLAE